MMSSERRAAGSASGTATVSVASGWRTRRPWALRTDSVAEHTSRTSSIAATSSSSAGSSAAIGQSARCTLPGAVAGVQAVVDLLGDERQQRRGDPHEHVEHGVQRVDGVDVAVPEALAAAADVPVRQRRRRTTGPRRTRRTGRRRPSPRHVLDELAGLGEHVAVEHVGRTRRRAPGRCRDGRRRWRTA